MELETLKQYVDNGTPKEVEIYMGRLVDYLRCTSDEHREVIQLNFQNLSRIHTTIRNLEDDIKSWKFYLRQQANNILNYAVDHYGDDKVLAAVFDE